MMMRWPEDVYCIEYGINSITELGKHKTIQLDNAMAVESVAFTLRPFLA